MVEPADVPGGVQPLGVRPRFRQGSGAPAARAARRQSANGGAAVHRYQLTGSVYVEPCIETVISKVPTGTVESPGALRVMARSVAERPGEAAVESSRQRSRFRSPPRT